MTEKAKTATARRPYHPPQLEQVQLVAEEAVLVGCKTRSASGEFPDNCMTGAPPEMCMRPGT